MSDATLSVLAAELGVKTKWIDADGHEQTVTPESLREVIDALGFACGSDRQIAESHGRVAQLRAVDDLPALVTATVGQPVELDIASAGARSGAAFRIKLESGPTVDGRIAPGAEPCLPSVAEPGYHRLCLGDAETLLAVAPPCCFSLSDIPQKDRKRWGLAAQIYALRRSGDGGIGDFTALAELASLAADAGADALAMSPVHAMFSAAPVRRSPYSPSSRRFLNALMIDPHERFDADDVAAAMVGLDAAAELESASIIDWPFAGARKLALLRALYRRVIAYDARARAEFEAFRDRGGDALERHARFETLHERNRANGKDDWRDWPASDLDGTGNELSPDDAHDIRFHAFVQWLAARGLQRAQRTARDSGMAIGLVADLAVGSDPGGSDAWTLGDEMLADLTIGAPPDSFNARGQNWGLSAFSPLGLRRHGFRGFIDTLRAAMRFTGGVRIDHVMNLMRLWVVPRGASALEGAYLAYPMQDLARLISLESLRHRTIVIGEDLGVVPHGFRDQMQRLGILGTDVLCFMRNASGAFLAPHEWRPDAVAMTTTHDLPTLAGWWDGNDIDVRAQAGGLSATAVADERVHRSGDRDQLADAIRNALDHSTLSVDSDTDTLVDAAVAFVGASASRLVLVPVEDAFGLTDQTNIPGTIDSYPNWQRRMPDATAHLFEMPAVLRRLRALARARP
ncbi:MAG: 4-alpha-glucanotransferase [Rhodanobacteraceae bacterium]